MSIRNYGWKKSSGNLGVQSFQVGNNLTKIASSSNPIQHFIPENVPVFDQLKLSSCVANAVCGMYQILMSIQDPNKNVALSRLFLYWNARLLSNDTMHDAGSFIHNALQSLRIEGICEEKTWDYNPAKVLSQPNQLAYKEGDDNTLGNFYQITSSGNQRLLEIETAVQANHPVVFGTQIDVELENYDGNPQKVFDAPTSTEIGGHALLCIGVRRNPNLEFYIRNSWSSAWGIDGHFWMSASYMANSFTDDIFVGTMMSNLLV